MSDEAPQINKKLNISLDYRIIAGILLLVIVLMLALWRPWTTRAVNNSRTIRVTGQATIKAEPDQFTFYPTYQFTNADKDAALAELTKKSDEVVAKLKELGVADSKIKTNANNYEYYYPEKSPDNNYSLTITIEVGDRELTQKVQDYLLATSPQGTITPQPTFSQTKQKELEDQARDKATQDARSKADKSAKNLGFKIASVKSVEEGNSGGGIMPYAERSAIAPSPAADMKLSVQPGENEFNYSVTVEYYIR